MSILCLPGKSTVSRNYERPANQFFLTLVLVTAFLTSSCSSFGGALGYEEVKPWERGVLARDGMQPVLNTVDQSIDEHIYFSREASTGGGGVRGGGCGCN
ncbi:MAG: DUF4266 domain-containing protein [Granulosicoccus sp.]